MSNILFLETIQVNEGLTTQTYTVPTGGAGLYNVKIRSTEPVPTSVSIVINKNGSPIYTAPTMTPTQSAIQCKVPMLLADADVITVVLSSSAAGDNLANVIKTNISIGQGQN